MANKKRVNVSRKPIRGKKAPLGQNFLTDPGAARKIVDALGDAGAATVIEIGPGRGVLTDLLALRAGRLIAIELDRDRSDWLRDDRNDRRALSRSVDGSFQRRPKNH